jgi:hypothetical protein
VHGSLPADGDFHDALLILAGVAKNLFNRRCIHDAFRGRLAGETPCRCRMVGSHFLDRVPDVLDGTGQLLRLAHAANMHEVNLGLVVEKMVMQCGHFQTAREGGIHGGSHLVFKDDGVSHHHGPVGARREGCPGAEAGEWLQRHSVHLDGNIGPGPANSDHALFGYGCLYSSRLADLVGIELRLCLGQ